MKKLLFLTFVLFPGILLAQAEVTLLVKQSPGINFSIAQTDTTIVTGSSVVLAKGLTVSGGSGNYTYQWTPVNGLSNNNTLNPIATPIDSTVYILTVTDQTGCLFSLIFNVNVRNPAVFSQGLSEDRTLEAILFPNPGNGTIKVRLTGKSSEKIELLVFDVNGKFIERQIVSNFSGNQLETLQMNLPCGVYTLKIQSEFKLISRKFIVQ